MGVERSLDQILSTEPASSNHHICPFKGVKVSQLPKLLLFFSSILWVNVLCAIIMVGCLIVQGLVTQGTDITTMRDTSFERFYLQLSLWVLLEHSYNQFKPFTHIKLCCELPLAQVWHQSESGRRSIDHENSCTHLTLSHGLGLSNFEAFIMAPPMISHFS